MNLASFRGQPLGHRFRKKLQYALFRQSWNIGVTRYPVAAVAGLEGSARQRQALDNLLWMAERRDAFAADPFIIQSPTSNDDYLIFFEHFAWAAKRGRIDCVGFRDGEFRSASPSLESPFHLSYPFILTHDDTLVMIPEHPDSPDLSFFRFDGNGVVTEKVAIGHQLGLLDNTFVHHDERYWMFATHAGPNANTELHIYHADTLDGAWIAHAMNPVKRDRTNARPAGPFIRHGGDLFRPAQDCGSHYGAGIVVNRVKTLTEDAFEEEPVSEIRPDSGHRYDYGLHTISSAGDYTVIDGARMESRIHPVLDSMGRHVRPKSIGR